MGFNNTEMELLIEGMYKNQLKNVNCLKFHGVKFESECLKSLSSYLKDVNPKKFQELSFSFIENLNNFDSFCEMLSKNTHLRKITILSCDISANSGNFAKALAMHEALEELVLISPNLNSEFFAYLP